MTNRTRLAGALLVAALAAIVTQDALREDLSPIRHWISHLSLGRWGLINCAALVAAGLGVLTVRTHLRRLDAGKWPVRWAAVAGAGLVIAGLFVTDAPPGTRYPEAFTWHGQVHDVGGTLTFLGLFATALATRRRPYPPGGLLVAIVVAVAWVAAGVMAGIAFSSEPPRAMPTGLAERVAFFAGLGWMIRLAFTTPQPATDHHE
ncbi:DUF998 domain-containing protein [Dactylosporangium sp. NPDC005572]|uniref:DUF998 domain-containing protein n=1 Tax=Dactylosporangium sp. NPDC005572 TaxID=3156889 RepID=UPI0033A25146